MQIYYTAQKLSAAAPNAATELIFSEVIVFHHEIMNFKGELPTPKGLENRSLQSQRSLHAQIRPDPPML